MIECGASVIPLPEAMQREINIQLLIDYGRRKAALFDDSLDWFEKLIIKYL